ncbi:galactokinase [Mollicutes bacterium LVI A0078]|nr:galactokinase [Mollicutes bacterium LVI A0075]WOO90384.1 galactokinase [Mollicutes bacterium LVI A0078]
MSEKFLELFEVDYNQEYFSPGRINLIGEHIDYNGGMVFPMAINLGTHGYLRMREDKIVRLYSLNFEDKGVIEFDIDSIKYDDKYDWANYVQGVIDVFVKAGHKIEHGFDLLVNGTIPNGSGLSSSASLEVLIGKILIDNNDLGVDGTKLALLAQKAENEFIGVNCGIMDQFIIANGTREGALSINTDTLEYATVRFDLGDNVIVVLNSKKKRGLVDSAYNARRTSCENAAEVAKAKYGTEYLCQLTVEQLDSLEVKAEDYKRARHAIEEQERVELSMQQLADGDISGFGQTLYAGHKSLKELFEVSCDELDFIVDGCKELGAVGARMTGAGFGGCCIAVMHKDEVRKLDSLVADYKAKFDLDLEYYEVVANDKTQRVN